MSSKDSRICFVGDSLVQGTGDQAGLGWPGRLIARLNHDSFAVTGYNLGVRRETSEDIRQRWESECDRRLPVSSDNFLVFSFGVNDTTLLEGEPRVEQKKSVHNLQQILSAAARRYPTIMIGPTPVDDDEQSKRIEALNAAYQATADSLSVPYLSVFDRLTAAGTWCDEMRAGDGSHPGQGGYQLLTDLVDGWHGWWFRR